VLNSICITEHEDNFDPTRVVREGVLLSTYPVAMWLASNWWRLLYESRPCMGSATTDWKLSHEMPSANESYLWPVVVFESEGPSIKLTVPTKAGSKDNSLRYLNTSTKPYYILRDRLQNEIVNFISGTIARLNEKEVIDTDLAKLWAEVQDESCNQIDSAYRSIEASLGFDPDQGPSLLIEQLLDLSSHAGIDTIRELAPFLFTNQHQAVDLGRLFSSAFSGDTPGLLGHARLPAISARPNMLTGSAPWMQARRATHELRQSLSIGSGKLETEILCDLLGLDLGGVYNEQSPFGTLPLSLGIRNQEGLTRYYLRWRNRTTDESIKWKSIRFQLARLIGDELIRANSAQGWLACTDSHTWRQAFQRAFAAELLCPPEVISERCGALSWSLADEVMEDVSREYEVSELVVRHHRQNLQEQAEILEAG